MLNYRGIYYARSILDHLKAIRNNLCDLKILKTSDLGENTNLATISASISTDFISTELPAIIVKGYSENIKDDFFSMGKENLAILPEASKYFDDLKKVYESHSNNKGFEYFKLFYRYQYHVINSLENAILKAERREGTPVKREGFSYFFDTTLDNITSLSGMKDDYTKMGLRIPGGEGKFVQIDGSDMYRSKTSSAAALSNPSSVNISVVINISCANEKELQKIIYPIVRTYKNKPIEIIGMMSATELVEMLREDYNATSSNVIVDMEPFYEQAEKIVRQNLQKVVYFVTGKNKAYRVIDCEKQGEWPLGVIKASTVSDLSNVNLLTKRSFDLALSRKNEKNLQSSRRVASQESL